MRDPRESPHAGDVLQKPWFGYPISRRVIEVSSGGHGVRYRKLLGKEMEPDLIRWCHITRWRKWAAGAEIVTRYAT